MDLKEKLKKVDEIENHIKAICKILETIPYQEDKEDEDFYEMLGYVQQAADEMDEYVYNILNPEDEDEDEDED